MSNEILITVAPGETRAALLHGGVVQEVYIERPQNISLVGNIYMGKVSRLLPGLEAAFVDIGIERNGFLHLSDVVNQVSKRRNNENPKVTDIRHALHEGQLIMVQVIKNPINDKGARLTTEISLVSRYFAYLPAGIGNKVSHRIRKRDERQRLQDSLALMLSKNKSQGAVGSTQQRLTGSYIVRTAAEGIGLKYLQSDLSFLQHCWEAVQLEKVTIKKPGRVFEEMALQVRVMRDLVDEKTTSILVDCADVFDQLGKIMDRYHQSSSNLLVYYDGEKPLFQHYKVEEEVTKALQRRVNLDSGGSVVFDQTEAMTTVDVNTGGDIGHRDLEKAAFNTNMQASKVIARQIRLRNVGGIIIIDFIDMDDDSHRQKVLASLKKALLVDTVATFISGFTELGLVQVNRKRINKSLRELLSDNCPTCDGVGSIKSLSTISCEIWREISRAASAYNCQNIRIQASPEVTGYLATEERSVLTEIEKSINCTIQLRDDELYSREQFDIIPV